MNKTEAESKIEYLETSDEILAKGLRRIKRRHLTKPGEITLKDCQVVTEIRIDADLYNFLEAESKKVESSSIEKLLTDVTQKVENEQKEMIF